MARKLLLWATLPVAIACLLSATGRWWFVGEICCDLSLHAAVGLLPALIAWRRSIPLSAFLLGSLLVGLVPTFRAAWETRAPLPDPSHEVITAACANLYLYNDRALRPQAVSAALAEQPQIVVLSESISSVDRGVVPLLEYPYQIWQPQVGRKWHDCVVLLSKFPIIEHQIHDPDTQPYIVAKLDVGGRPLHVIALHTISPVSPQRLLERNQQLRDIAAVVAQLSAADTAPVLVLGDFNLTVASPTWRDFRAQSGLLRVAQAEPASWHSALGPLGITVDHLLGRGLALGPQTAFVIPGSDHRGIRGTLSW